MTDPSSQSWSNHYDMTYSEMQKQLPQEQSKAIDGSSENEVQQQLESQNQQMMAFRKTAEQKQGDPEVQQQSGWDHLNDCKIETSLQQFNSANTAKDETRQVTWRDIMQVKHCVETCIKSYMTKDEVIKALSTHAKIDPCFTYLVWQRLERENQEFFKKYYLWLKVKDQILMFNHLLEQQHNLMAMERALDFQQPRLHTSMQPHVVPSEIATQLTQQSGHSSPGCFGTDNKAYASVEAPTSRKSSLFDSSTANDMNFNQDLGMVSSEGFLCNQSEQLRPQFTTSNMVDTNVDGFLHMGNLEGMRGYYGQFSMNRSAPDLRTVFPNNQGSFPGPSFLSTSMDAFMSFPFQPTDEQRNLGPNTEPVYDSYGDKDLEEYMHMVHGRR